LLVDANGVPLVIRTAPANVSDHTLILPVVADFPEIGGKPGPPRKHLMSSTPIAVTTATRLGIGFVRTYSFLYRSFLPGYQLLTPTREYFHIP